MTLHAIDDVEDAVAATRALLWPVDARRWAKLAVVVFFVGGVGGANPLQFGGGTSGGGGTPPEGLPEGLPTLGSVELAAILAVVAVLVVVGFAFALVGSVMEFVFVESLRHETVAIRQYWGRRWRQGLRLFGFRLAVGAVTLGVVAAVGAGVLLPVLGGDGAAAVGLLAVAIPVVLAVVVAGGLLTGFTTAFVVPVMVSEDCGLLAGWRRFWPTLTGRIEEYAVYAVVAFLLRIAGGIVASVATGVGALAVAVPLGLVGLVGGGLLAVSPVGWAVVGLAAAAFVLAVAALAVLAAVPVRTFLRYYALLVLGDTNEAFDVVGERRRAVRD